MNAKVSNGQYNNRYCQCMYHREKIARAPGKYCGSERITCKSRSLVPSNLSMIISIAKSAFRQEKKLRRVALVAKTKHISQSQCFHFTLNLSDPISPGIRDYIVLNSLSKCHFLALSCCYDRGTLE